MSDFLFNEFQAVSSKQWKQKIQVELNGEDYNKTLVTDTNEDIKIKPFYPQDNFHELKSQIKTETFKISQTIFVKHVKTSNYIAVRALNKGIDALQFIVNEAFDFKILLKDLFITPKPELKIFFQFNFLDLDFILSLMDFVKDKNVYLNIDLIGNLSRNGNWYHSKEEDHEILQSLIKLSTSNIGIIGIDVSHYQNSGAHIVQQIAYALSHAKTYLDFLFDLNKTHDLDLTQLKEIVKNFQFNFAIGPNYFFEIAKLRAFRILWKLLLKEYDLNSDANIFAEPSLRNKTIYDYNVNMLRTTTECMSAILGGANVISNKAYDTIFHKKNNFGERIARNQLLILKEESHLKNSEFANGSYYIEDITSSMANKALHLFKEIDKNGGFVKQLFEGTIQRKIMENAKKEQEQFDDGNIVLLGTNKLPDKDNRMKDDLEIYPFLQRKKRETEIQPIIAHRWAEKIEQDRIMKESFS